MSNVIYLDHAATTPCDPRVVAAMLPYFTERFANPSSLYRPAQVARQAVEAARERIAAILGCSPAEIVFTGSGSEADNLAIKGVALARRHEGNHLITSAVEHHAVLHACEHLQRHFGFEVTYLPVDQYGRVDPDAVERALTPRTILVSIMLANNEVGTLQPVAEIARRLRGRGVLLHTDAVQAGAMCDLNVERLGVDLMALAAHKVYGPKGIGLLYVRRGTPLLAQIDGGGQEGGRRSGTLNVPSIVGFAEALALAHAQREEENRRLAALRDRIISGVLARVPDATLTGHPSQRLPNSASFALAGVDGQALLVALDLEGICASGGSACSSGSPEPSHVLAAMGVSADRLMGPLRLTVGRGTTEAEVDRLLEILPPLVERARALGGLLAAE